MTGAELIEAERLRQITEEGWTPEHDDAHGDGELLEAAIAYARVVELRRSGFDTVHLWQLPAGVFAGTGWPWARSRFKPAGDVRDLVRAGALIAAEIDRLRRAAAEVVDG